MRYLGIAVCIFLLGAAAPTPSRPKLPAVPRIKHFTGRFIAFSEVDYVYAAFCVGDSVEWLGVSDSWAAYFAAAHAGTPLDIEARLISRPGEEPEYGLYGASLRGYSSKQWWSALEKMLGYDRAEKLFQAFEDSLADTAPEKLDCNNPRSYR